MLQMKLVTDRLTPEILGAEMRVRTSSVLTAALLLCACKPGAPFAPANPADQAGLTIDEAVTDIKAYEFRWICRDAGAQTSQISGMAAVHGSEWLYDHLVKGDTAYQPAGVDQGPNPGEVVKKFRYAEAGGFVPVAYSLRLFEVTGGAVERHLMVQICPNVPVQIHVLDRTLSPSGKEATVTYTVDWKLSDAAVQLNEAGLGGFRTNRSSAQQQTKTLRKLDAIGWRVED